MIISSSQGNIEAIGDVKEFKTSIDPKNLEFITTLLSSNLYSNPEQSFIREIVSNAWDSHVEAGTTDIPVIVRFKRHDNYWSVTIRDYGVGLSPERFKTIFCNIGSSTKRESNDYIGCFGIGRYSSLACSNSVYITSYYNGIAYHYIMVKSENTIVTNLVHELPTTEKNGVETTIVNIDNIQINKYSEALQYITFFPNVYVDGPAFVNSFNSIKIKHFNTFAVASIPMQLKILLGNVLYPLQSEHFDRLITPFIDKIRDTNIVIKFNIGDLSVTPNRENIIYNSSTIKKITDRLKEAKEELIGLLRKHLDKDYNDPVEYIKITDQPLYYDPLDDTLTSDRGYNGKLCLYDAFDLFNANITLRGIDFRDQKRNISFLLNMECINYKGTVYNGIIYNSIRKGHYLYRDRGTFKDNKFIILAPDTKLTATLKEYLRPRYHKYNILTDFNCFELKKYIVDNVSKWSPISISDFNNLDILINGIYDRIKNNAVYIDVKKDEDFLKFKEELKERNKTQKVNDVKPSILYVWSISSGRFYKEKRNFSTLSSMISYIKNMKCGIILENMKTNEEACIGIAKARNFNVIKAKQETVDYIRSLNLSCIVDLQYLLTKDKFISRIHTILKYFPKGLYDSVGSDYLFAKLCSLLDNPLREGVTKLKEDLNKCNLQYLYLAKNDKIPIDSYTEFLCLKLEKYIEKYMNIIDLFEISRCEKNILFIAAAILKSKAFRINSNIYNTYRNNKLLRLLCKK